MSAKCEFCNKGARVGNNVTRRGIAKAKGGIGPSCHGAHEASLQREHPENPRRREGCRQAGQDVHTLHEDLDRQGRGDEASARFGRDHRGFLLIRDRPVILAIRVDIRDTALIHGVYHI